MANSVIDLVDRQVRRAELAQKRLLEDGRVQPEQPGPVVTVSRELGSGGRLAARALADMLDFSHWDSELVEQIAADAHVGERLVRALDERVLSETEVLVRHMAGEPKIGGFLYKRQLTRTLLHIARIGSAVILGRGANFVLPQALNVRVIASKGLRIHNMVQFEGLKPNEAEHLLEVSDRQRAEYTRRLWGRDQADPLLYDMVLRMDEMTPEHAAKIIATAVEVRFPTTRIKVASS